MNYRKLLSILAAGAMAVSMLGMPAYAEDASADAPAAADTAATDTAAADAADDSSEMVASYLTGKQVPASYGRKRPLAIMMENTPDALPQYGIENADIVYEAMVEGSITRLMGIFENYEGLDRIGTVRSCRPYYVYFAREFNAYYAHYGQVVYAVPILQLPTTADIAGLPYGEDGQDYTLNDGSSAFWRIDDRPAPHNVVTNYQNIQDVVEKSGWSTDYASGYTGHYQFAPDGQEVNLDNGQIAKTVIPGFTYNHARFDYNESDKLYYRSEFGDPQVDGSTGNQLAYKNIIIQECPSTMFDDKYLWTDPTGAGEGGTGWYITNGRAEKITWQKENWNADDPVETTVSSINVSFDVRECDFNVTRYYDASGNQITLNQGKTFVEIVRNQDDPLVVLSDDPSIDTSIIDSLG